MNKRQIKRKVKQAKLNKERGQILSLEERHDHEGNGRYVD